MEKQDFKKKEKITKIPLYILGISLLIGFVYLVLAALTVSTVTLNSTSGYNLTSDNLTVWTDQDDNASVRLIYDWRLDGESLALMHVPFDYGTTNSSAIDFTSYNTIVWMGGESSRYPIFNSTFGAIGGSVRFEDATYDERVTINAENTSLPISKLGDDVTVAMWVYIDTLAYTYFYQEWDDDDEKWQIGFTSSGVFKLFDDTDNGGYHFTSNFTFAADTWYHVAVVGSDRNWKGYVDGNLVMDNDSSDGIVDMVHHSRHYFGARRYGSPTDWEYELMGSMDELMIFNRSLSSEQINQLYNEQSGSLNTSTIVSEETVVPDNWSVNIIPVEGNVSMGDAILSNNLIINPPSLEAIILNSTNGLNLTSDDLTAYPINVIPNSSKIIYEWFTNGSSINPLIMPFDGGLLAESGEKVKDYSGNYNGSVTNAVYNSTGGYDGRGAYYFDGSGDYISTTLDDANVHSVSFWMNPSATANDDYVMGQRYDSIEESGNWQLDFTGSNELRFVYYTASDTYSEIISSTTFSTGSWYHVVVTTDGSNTHMYVNGSLVANGTGWNTYFGGGNNDDTLKIGRSGANAAWYYFKGYLDEVKLFTNELSLAQVNLLYNGEENVIDSSMTNVTENWSTCGTPNDNIDDGSKVCSNNITILPPFLDGIILNSTLGTNLTTEDLTANLINLTPPYAVLNYTWYKNNIELVYGNISTALWGYEFNEGSNSTYFPDIVNGMYNGDGTTAPPDYYSSGGYDELGFVHFDNAYIKTGFEPIISSSQPISISFWFSTTTTSSDYLFGSKNGSDNILYGEMHGPICSEGEVAFTIKDSDDSVINAACTTNTWNDGEWHNAIFVDDGIRQKIYIDGDLEANVSSERNNDLNFADREFVLGAYNDDGFVWGSGRYVGDIDDFFWFEDADISSSPEIINNITNKMFRTGFTDFVSDYFTTIGDVWKVDVSPNFEGEFGDTVSSNNLTILPFPPTIDSVILNSTNGTNLTTENMTAYLINLSSGANAIYDWREDGISIAVLNMPFEVGALCSGKTCDYSSFANNGIIDGAVYNSTGGYDGNGSYEFDGIDDAIDIDYNQDFNFSNGEGFTVMAWMNPNDLVNNRGDIVSQYLGTDYNRIWDLQIYNGQARFAGCSNGTLASCKYAYSGVDVNESGTWYHLAGTWNGTHLQVYVNGIAEDPTPEPLASIHSTSNTGVRIGHDTATEWYNGTIDEVMIFNRTLSDEQILALYNNRTDLIVSNETSIGDNWSVQVTPNDGIEDGGSVISNSLIILALDTCTCPSSPANWNVNMEDNCWLNSVCNISSYDLTFYGVGNFTINSTLYVNELNNLSNGMTVWIKPDGLILITN